MPPNRPLILARRLQTLSRGLSLPNSFTALFSGQALNALTGLVLVKAVAIYILPAQWGVYSLALSAMTLGHTLLISPVLQSLKAAQAEYGWLAVLPFYRRVLVWLYALVLLVGSLIGVWLGHPFMALVVCLAAVGQGVYLLSSEFVNLTGRFKLYSLIQASYGVINLLLFGGIVILAGYANATGLWISLALLNGLFAGISCWLMKRHLRGSSVTKPVTIPIAADLTIRLRRYIGPLIGLAIASWSVSYADRYIIRYLLTNADVGIYSIGYGVGSKLLLLLGPFIIHLSSRLFQLRSEGGNDSAAWQLQRQYLLPYTGIATIACLLFYSIQNRVGHLVLSDQYQAAFEIGPLVAFGYLFLTLINLLEIKWYVYSQTKYILWHYLVGAIANISLNFLLIPVMGLKGAALATLFGYMSQFLVVVWLYRRSRRVTQLQHDNS